MNRFRMSNGSLPPLGSISSSSVAARGMNDARFKPKLLRSLLGELVPEPDEKREFLHPSELYHVISAVKTHGLLSEFAADRNLVSSWSSAVDAWISRLSELTSNQSADKVWAAICLLGLTCQECSSARFVSSYRQWFDSILPHIQTLSDTPFLRAASFASMSDLLTRLGGIPNEKKNGTSLSAKLVQPVLKLLNEDASETELEEALCLLCKLLNVFPSSVSRHYDNVEASIVSGFASENGNINLFKKLGQCLIMLPKSKGTVNSWSLMVQKVILFLNDQLTIIFQGLEEETTGNEVVRLIVPSGRDPPPPLGGLSGSSRHSHQSIMPEQVLVSKVCILMSCCGTMLTGSYPVQVPIPVHPLIALIKRVLMVDGSFLPSSQVMTITRHEFICSELPTLHACSLDLLTSIVNGLRSQLLPHVAGIIRILKDYIGTCSLPEPRIKVYSVMRAMLLSLGIGIAIALSDVVINNTLADLDISARIKNGTYHAPYSSEAGPSQKTRKHAASTPAAGLALERYLKPAPVPVRIAALEVLEALLTVAGAVRSDDWRSKVDHLLFTVASNACKVMPGYGKVNPSSQDLQLAALRALLASLLSPGRSSPLHLVQSLELFRKGSQATGTNVGHYCQVALLALEPLIHPRAPLIDFQALADAYSGPSNGNGEQAHQPSQREIDDDMVNSWMVDDETEAGLENNSKTDEEPSRMAEDLPVGELLPGDAPSAWPSVDGAAAAAEDEGAYMQLLDIDLNRSFEESDVPDAAYDDY